MKSFQSFFRDLGLQRKLMLVSVFTTIAAMLVALLALFSYDVLVARPRVVRDTANRSELLARKVANCRRGKSPLRPPHRDNSLCATSIAEGSYRRFDQNQYLRARCRSSASSGALIVSDA